jgi:hypothetical protein
VQELRRFDDETLQVVFMGDGDVVGQARDIVVSAALEETPLEVPPPPPLRPGLHRILQSPLQHKELKLCARVCLFVSLPLSLSPYLTPSVCACVCVSRGPNGCSTLALCTIWRRKRWHYWTACVRGIPASGSAPKPSARVQRGRWLPGCGMLRSAPATTARASALRRGAWKRPPGGRTSSAMQVHRCVRMYRSLSLSVCISMCACVCCVCSGWHMGCIYALCLPLSVLVSVP